jgi:hypothetical protein
VEIKRSFHKSVDVSVYPSIASWRLARQAAYVRTWVHPPNANQFHFHGDKLGPDLLTGATGSVRGPAGSEANVTEWMPFSLRPTARGERATAAESGQNSEERLAWQKKKKERTIIHGVKRSTSVYQKKKEKY